MSFWLHHVIPQSCLTAGELKDCLGDELQRHSVISFTFFSQRFWAAKLAYTHQLAVVWGNRLSHLFSDEIRGNPQAARGRPHILFSPLSLLLYSIILSDRPLL